MQFQIVAQSALSTLTICFRQANKDARKVWAIARPTLLWALYALLICGAACYWLGRQARPVFDAAAGAIDAHVAEFETEPQIEVEAVITPAAMPTVYAAAAIAPVTAITVSQWDTMTRDELRSTCQELGIRWSHVIATESGKKRHLTVAEMRSALGR